MNWFLIVLLVFLVSCGGTKDGVELRGKNINESNDNAELVAKKSKEDSTSANDLKPVAVKLGQDEPVVLSTGTTGSDGVASALEKNTGSVVSNVDAVAGEQGVSDQNPEPAVDTDAVAGEQGVSDQNPELAVDTDAVAGEQGVSDQNPELATDSTLEPAVNEDTKEQTQALGILIVGENPLFHKLPSLNNPTDLQKYLQKLQQENPDRAQAIIFKLGAIENAQKGNLYLAVANEPYKSDNSSLSKIFGIENELLIQVSQTIKVYLSLYNRNNNEDKFSVLSRISQVPVFQKLWLQVPRPFPVVEDEALAFFIDQLIVGVQVDMEKVIQHDKRSYIAIFKAFSESLGLSIKNKPGVPDLSSYYDVLRSPNNVEKQKRFNEVIYSWYISSVLDNIMSIYKLAKQDKKSLIILIEENSELNSSALMELISKEDSSIPITNQVLPY